MEYLLLNQPRVFPRRKVYLFFKRLMDFSICLFTLPFALLAMIICAIAIKMDDPDGAVFFVQERIGKGGRPFRIYKFRTMKANLDDSMARAFMKAYVRGDLGHEEEGKKVYKPVSATKQIFRVGRILRKTSLDELPQIINVLKGEMSIIGPRPNVTFEVDDYRPWHYERLEVLPGITGLAQVRGRSCIGFNHLVRYDIQYIEQQSLKLDFRILWWTVKAIVRGSGAI